MTSRRASSNVVGEPGAPIPAMILTRADSKGAEQTEAATACSRQAVNKMGVYRSAGAAGPSTDEASRGMVRLRNSYVPNEPAPAPKPAAIDASMPSQIEGCWLLVAFTGWAGEASASCVASAAVTSARPPPPFPLPLRPSP